MNDLQPTKVKKIKRAEKSELKSRMKNFLMFLPNLVKLLGKLLVDSRVPAAEKALFGAAIVYVIVPLDFIPDFFPFVGQVDDIYLVALTLLRLLSRADANILRENWSGGGDIVALADSIAKLAPKLLPKKITRVLSAKVKLTPTKEFLDGASERKTPLVVEVSPNEKDGKVKIPSPS